MNKKIKLSLISSLVTVSSIGIILPIASCSSSSNLENKININQDMSKKDALALAIAQIANQLLENTNSDMNSKEFIQIIKEYTSSDSKVWIALGNFFTFDSGHSFNDVVEKATISGIFPEIGTEIKIKIILTLKSGYIASDSSKLTLSDLKIGVAANYPTGSVSIVVSKDPKAKEELALALAKTVNPSATSIDDGLTQEQYDKLDNKFFNIDNKMLWNALKNYFIVSSGHVFDDSIENVQFFPNKFILGEKVNCVGVLWPKKDIELNGGLVVRDLIVGIAI